MACAGALARAWSLIFAGAVAFNYPWELAQTPLYTGGGFPGVLWHCFVASLGDGLLVVVLYAAVAVAVRSFDWYMRPDVRTYVVLAAVGLALGIAVEWWGLQALDERKRADLVVEPQLPRHNEMSPKTLRALITAGEDAITRSLPQLRALFQGLKGIALVTSIRP